MTEDKHERQSISSFCTQASRETVTDPYKDINISTLPKWWQDAIHEFEIHSLRPYQPSRFEDGKLKYPTVKKLESKFDIGLKFIGFNVDHEDDWTILLDGEEIGTIGHVRSPAGYTIFEMESTEFVEFVTVYVKQE